MIINLSFKQIDPTEAIKTYASEKSERLKKYFRGRITVSWNFSVRKQNHIAHCHLLGNHMDYFGEGLTQDLFASIDLAVDRIERQLRRHKEIVKNRLHRAPQKVAS